MLKRSLLLIAIPFLLFFSCGQFTGPSGKIWFYTHSTDNKYPRDTTLTPASFITLNKDGSYTRDFGRFDYGTWLYNNKQILLTSHTNEKLILPVNYLTATEMQVGPPDGPFDNFESQPGSFGGDPENPFSKENNQWRITAVSKETSIQIRNRLLNHCKFWELYFTWALNNSIQYIDVRSTPTPIKIYGNGFGLIPFEKLNPIWKSYFFDEEDCRMANNKIEALFDRNAIAWPHTENKYKFFISAFQQLQQKLQ